MLTIPRQDGGESIKFNSRIKKYLIVGRGQYKVSAVLKLTDNFVNQ